MTVQAQVINDLIAYLSFTKADQLQQIKTVLEPYKIQIRPNSSDKFEDWKSIERMTARDCLVRKVMDWYQTHGVGKIEELSEVMSDFRVQRKSRHRSKECEIVDLQQYRKAAVDYGPVAGGPPSKSGSGRKICPKCKSLGLYLASGYKEKYYSCLYCGYYQDIETKTYQY